MTAGLLAPVIVGGDGTVTDAAVLRALVRAESALARAWTRVGVAPDAATIAVTKALAAAADEIDVPELAAAAVAGGNPVIPLVVLLKARVAADARVWVHRGATSQDILDTALMLIARDALARIADSMAALEAGLTALATAQRDTAAAARTLTQHAVPTTVGLRAAVWLHGVRRAVARLAAIDPPAQLGGAGGTLASFVQIGGADAAAALPAAFAAELGLATPAAPWHTTRWPVTELGDALVQAVDAVAVIAADVTTLGRTEVGELSEGAGGGSSAMPQKQNPAESVLIRSAALRAPQLGATLHLAAALAVDERPDGAWHAEWPTLQDLLALALGATAHAANLVAGLQVHTDAVARNLARTGGLIVAERLSLVLTPLIGRERVTALVSAASAGGDLAALVRTLPEASDLNVADLLDPAAYTGLAGRLVDDATAPPAPPASPAPPAAAVPPASPEESA
ncbi:3-carboxy-cis,cis-muconate cycloisomerase [Microbacterium kribbense]|uniref:3-carboxy-cis,cis-muconate cycloisomerase n=1 Tax=Microbacterium kribbense TaxID=433645 RepID=A0ABP7G6V1_9MICO